MCLEEIRLTFGSQHCIRTLPFVAHACVRTKIAYEKCLIQDI